MQAPDLLAVARVALDLGLGVARVEQPYRVAGRRSPAPAHQLDAAWNAVVEQLAAGPFAGLPLISGGRSSGARVACRTAAATRAAGVLCLAFPLRPPGRDGRDGRGAGTSRLPELKQVPVPVLVVQGRRDPFGVPRSSGSVRVVRVDGDHGLKTDLPAVATAAGSWLAELLDSRR